MGIRKKVRNQWKAQMKVDIAARRKKKAVRMRKAAAKAGTAAKK